MNINGILIELLRETGLPVEQDMYEGKEDKYIIFTYEDEKPEIHGDDYPIADTAYMQIQLITPKNYNYFHMKEKIRDLLEKADFSVTSIRTFLGDVYVGTEKTRQTIFQVEYTKGR